MSDSEPAVALTEEGNIEIILPKKSSKFPDKIASRLKASATLIVAITGLIAAIGSWFKPVDQSVNKESYETLANAIKEVSEQARENHDNNLALKGFVDGALGRTLNTTPLLAYSAPAASTTPTTPTLRPLSRIGVTNSRTGGGSVISRPAPSLSAAIASALASHDVVPPTVASAEPVVLMPDSPAIGPTPPAIAPPPFDTVLKRAGQ
jgi:hypothetical protein